MIFERIPLFGAAMQLTARRYLERKHYFSIKRGGDRFGMRDLQTHDRKVLLPDYPQVTTPDTAVRTEYLRTTLGD